MTVVGPLLGPIQRDLGLSDLEAGLLNTLPLLAFATFSPVAPRLARRWGPQRTLFGAMLLLSVGIVARSLSGVAALFAGTVVIGAAVALGNVLLPQVIKHHFPERIGALTGVYVSSMGLVAALASGVAVPIAGAVPAGWQTALGCWAGLSLVAAAAWGPQLARAAPSSGVSPEPPATAGLPWRSPLAWQVTGYMGLQSLGFYVMIAWLPSILQDYGYSSAAAGWTLFGYQFVALASSLALPLLTGHLHDQRGIAVAAAGCALLGYLGLALAPAAVLVWVTITGLGGGACLVMALSFIALRAPDAAHTAALSGMAQSIGYLLAAAGPVLFGLLHGYTASWTMPLVALGATAALLAASGLGAGRPRHIAPRSAVRS